MAAENLVGEPFEKFTETERFLPCGTVVARPGTVVPWLTPYGVNTVTILGIRHGEDGRVELGLKSDKEGTPVWVSKERVHPEWPDY
jgi:hypothetical protein